MRWLRVGLLTVVVVGLVGLVGSLVYGTVSSAGYGGGPACAVNQAIPTEQVVGTVVSRGGSAVTFATEDGRTLVVSYPSDGARFLHPGSTYRVDARGQLGELSSTIMAFCGVPGGTLHVDGTPINTGFWSHEQLADHLPWMVAVAVLFGALGTGIVARERRRYPPLTIDGKPLSRVR
jgi:hypothetical protein